MALNPDSIPTNEQVRETLFDRFYYPYKRQIWAAITVLVVLVVGYLAVRQIQERRADEQWSRLASALELGRAPGNDPEMARQGAEERIQALRRLVADFPADSVTPFALNEMLNAQVEAGLHDDALETLGRLRTEHKAFVLNVAPADAVEGGSTRSLADRLEAQIRSEKEWMTKSEYTHPAPSARSMALVETTAGSFWMGFYDEAAPQHVANFVRLAKEGFYNGTQIYHVRTGGTPEAPTPMLFEGGSAASRFEGPRALKDPGTHDRDEPDAVIEPEAARERIRHVRGVVSAVSMTSGESSERFMVIAVKSGMDRYNGQTTPFAMVIDREGSFDAIDRICRATTYRTEPSIKSDPDVFRMGDHPYPPIWIRRVTIWRDEKLEDGHAWDASRASSPQAEPWEATLPPPPKPSDFAPKPPTPKEGEESPPK